MFCLLLTFAFGLVWMAVIDIGCVALAFFAYYLSFHSLV